MDIKNDTVVTKPLVSVIMPVYKVEKYVAKTIESVLNQTYKNIEFFAIDDGSPDNSGAICDSYKLKDSRLHVIHQENAGAPAARNSAIKIAKGKYLYFIDSDDYIEDEMIEKMVEYAESNKLDLVVTGFKMEYFQNNKNTTYETNCPNLIFPEEEFKKNAYQYFDNSLLSLPWNKLYKSSIVLENNILFPLTKWDDHHFNMEYLKHVTKVGMLNIKMYHWYRSRPGSETMINYSDPNMFQTRKNHFQHILNLYNSWGFMDDNTKNSIYTYFLNRVIQCIQEIFDNKKIIKTEKKSKVLEIFNDEIVITSLQYAKVSKKFRLITYAIRKKKYLLCKFIMSGVNFLRKRFPSIFIKMKENEVHGKKYD